MEAKVGLRLISWHKDIMHQYYQSPKTKDSSDCFLLNSEVNTWTKVHIGPTNSYLMFVYLVWTWKYIIIISIIKSSFLRICSYVLEKCLLTSPYMARLTWVHCSSKITKQLWYSFIFHNRNDITSKYWKKILLSSFVSLFTILLFIRNTIIVECIKFELAKSDHFAIKLFIFHWQLQYANYNIFILKGEAYLTPPRVVSAISCCWCIK